MTQARGLWAASTRRLGPERFRVRESARVHFGVSARHSAIPLLDSADVGSMVARAVAAQQATPRRGPCADHGQAGSPGPDGMRSEGDDVRGRRRPVPKRCPRNRACQRGWSGPSARPGCHVPKKAPSELNLPDTRGLPGHPALALTNRVHGPDGIVLRQLAGGQEVARLEHGPLLVETRVAQVTIRRRSQQREVAQTVRECVPLPIVELLPAGPWILRQYVLDAVPRASRNPDCRRTDAPRSGTG